ncbi:uncharacterized protein LOC126814966 [Patella vulgata]|uniref:uncharacterized protein LOC126814966 n=1 Tax=Patella vulgata TaxID=6465 RepID=UPI0024A928EC|nr:uncharacterized protein LOC126814966 [Patella vulgata]
MKEVNDLYQCAEARCSSFQTTCDNDGYVTEYRGQCTCVCPDGLDPQTGCTTNTFGNNSFEWPSGSYALIAAEGGCPPGLLLGYRTSWSEGFSWFQGSSLPFAGVQDHSKFNYEFCVSQNNFPNSKNYWGSGEYCILREGGSCPEGFGEGYVQFDDTIRSAAQNNTKSGELPDGVFGDDTRLEFCCRADGFKNVPLELPNDKALILYQNSIDTAWPECQAVANMNSRRFYYTFDNKAGDLAKFSGSLPKIATYPGRNSYLFYVCYYEPVTRPKSCGGVIELSPEMNTAAISSPNYPANYDNNQKCFWLIKGPPNSNILLNFDKFDVGTIGAGCDDTVEIRPANLASPNYKFCHHDGRTWRSHNNTLVVIFESGMSKVRSGFKASLKLILDEENCYVRSDEGMSYRGNINYTRDFTPCIPWSDVKHCRHSSLHSRDVDAGLDGNYCRNPGDGDRPWCYTEKLECTRDFCDVCGVEKAFDRDPVSKCEALKTSVTNFCTQDTRGFSACRKTCADQLPAINVAPSVGDISCSPPTALPDGTTNDAAKSSYSVGDQVTYTCNTRSTSSVALTCTTDGTWTGALSACKVCDDGWHAYNGNCYKVHPEIKTWSLARDKCVSQGATLIMPKTQSEMDFIHTIRDVTSSYWVGVSDLAIEGKWYWLDGTELTAEQSRFAPGQPANTTAWNDCAFMANEQGSSLWSDVYCSAYYQQRYICFKPNHDFSKTCRDLSDDCQEKYSADGTFCDMENCYAAAKCSETCKINNCYTSSCEVGWIMEDNKCYKLITDNLNYTAAVATCKSQGSIVSSMKTTKEKTLLDSLRGTFTLWIGATDDGHEGIFTWQDGTPVLASQTTWATGEPNNYWNFEHCVTYNGQWRDVYCNYYNFHRFVCSKNATHQDVSCATPITPANVTVISAVSNLTNGHTIRYKCNTNYWLESGDLNRGCLLSGQLGGSPPVCVLGSEANVLTTVNHQAVNNRGSAIPNFANGIFTTSHEQFYIPRGGEIVEWQLYSNKAGPIALLVLRPSGTNYTLIGFNEVNTQGSGEEFFLISLGNRVKVQADDSIGFYTPGSVQPIAADVHHRSEVARYPQHLLRRSVSSPTSTSALLNGVTYEFQPIENADAIIVSLRAVIGPSPL